jgi:3-oxoacyl-[acyl-carrier-protein] synthase II
VVVTGAGIITALGGGMKANADGFRAGRRAFRPVTLFDTSRQRVRVAAEVSLPERLPETRLTAKQIARMDRASRMLLIAACEAWAQAGGGRFCETPLALGTTAGGMSLGEDYYQQAVNTPQLRRRQPTRAVYYQAQAQGRVVLDALEIGGPVTVISTACASGTSAIGHAWELVRSGRHPQVLAAGYDTLTQLVFAGFDALQALTPGVCRPFDAGRDGLGIGEGAAALVIESLDHAKKRGAEILCEVAGFGASIDLHHLTQPHPEGKAALASMRAACRSARLNPEDIGYINAHGTGTLLNDGSEAAAINQWAGASAPNTRVSSTKASIGHLLGGAGAVEAAVCLMVLREQWLPPQTTCEKPDPVCAFQIVREPRDVRLDAVLSNSFGFGGVNASVVLRRWA